jgi:pimeloyl-ACP methyl ester carboxylesterase
MLAVDAAEFDSHGVRLHYVIEGSGPPVVLLHGLYANADMNWKGNGIIAQLAKEHQVIALDCRGHGQSQKPVDDNGYGVELAADVLRLLDHLGIAKTRIAGYSMGGLITMHLLTTHPERFESAVISGQGWLRTDSDEQAFLRQVTKPSQIAEVIGIPAEQAALMEIALGANAGGVPMACIRSLADLAVTEDAIRAITIPVTVIIGEQDALRPVAVVPLQKIRPDWLFFDIQGANHLGCLRRREFKERLIRSLR